MISPTKLGFREGNAAAPFEIELFYDINCPFSRKAFNTFRRDLIPTYKDKISFVIYSVVQPWHAQGTWLHEVVFAVNQMKPNLTLDWIDAYYNKGHFEAFRDAQIYDKSRLAIYQSLAAIVEKEIAIPQQEVLKKLIRGYPDSVDWDKDSDVRSSIKWSIKYHRKRGVHVTPTVFVNGIEDNNISSSWTAEEWHNYLSPLLKQT